MDGPPGEFTRQAPFIIPSRDQHHPLASPAGTTNSCPLFYLQSTCLSGCACIRPQVCDWVLENGFDPAAIDGLDGDALLSLEVPTIVGLQIAKTPDELRRFLELING